jgi:hypothetical protein
MNIPSGRRARSRANLGFRAADVADPRHHASTSNACNAPGHRVCGSIALQKPRRRPRPARPLRRRSRTTVEPFRTATAALVTSTPSMRTTSSPAFVRCSIYSSLSPFDTAKTRSGHLLKGAPLRKAHLTPSTRTVTGLGLSKIETSPSTRPSKIIPG